MERLMTFFRCLARSTTLALAMAGCATLGAGARADSLWVSSGGTGKPLELNNVQVTHAEAGQLFFKTATGNESKREFKQVVRMRLDDEPALNAAEDAYQAQKFDAATDGYLKALKS